MFVDASIKLRQTPHSPNFDTGQSKRKNFKLERTRALRPEPYFDTNLFFFLTIWWCHGLWLTGRTQEKIKQVDFELRSLTAWATHTHSLKHLHTNSYAYKESFEDKKSQLPWAIDTKMSPVHEVTKNVLIVVESLQPWMLEWTGDADGKLYQLWLTNCFLSLHLKARAVNWFTAESKSK